VLPGERHVYRFRAEQLGTFWYHTHQVSSKEVRRGLFGALVVEPRGGSTFDLDETIVAHTFDGVPTLNGNDGVAQRTLEPGTTARLRLVNSDSTPHRFALSGVSFLAFALDGTDLHKPSFLRETTIELGGGARTDVVFTVPDVPFWLSLADTDAGIAVNAGGRPTPLVTRPEQLFDPLGYGEPAPTPFDATSSFDRRFELEITRKPGFLHGRPGRQWALNGEIFPDVPVFVIEEGDLVHVTIVNDTGAVHPMHLHGHHLLVLSRDGQPATGSPWWVDTLNVEAGERYELAFRADNPGIWMDHCHNLGHAAEGLTMHVAYVGVTTPFEVGGDHDNLPE
jgi:FtsP/CotA-like multicopper oxidase with cupredoxin domain